MMKDHLMLIKHDDNCCEYFWDVNNQKYTIKGSSMLVLLLMNLQYMNYKEVLQLLPDKERHVAQK